MKTCTKCGVEKARCAFASDATRSDGTFPWCRACKAKYDVLLRDRDRLRIRAKRAVAYKANPEPAKRRVAEWAARHRDDQALKTQDRARHLMHKFGMTLAEFDALVTSQGGHCRTCESSKRLCVDHDHATGAVRGILCLRCNTLLGHIERSPGLAQKLMAYASAP